MQKRFVNLLIKNKLDLKRVNGYNKNTYLIQKRKHIMNSYQAKKIPIQSFLEVTGHTPKSSKQSELWYISPLRNETTPSFKVNLILNTWYDFGSNEGGTIIDLVCTMYKESVRDALHRLENSFGTRQTYTKPAITTPKQKKKVFELLEVKRITQPALHCYLQDRCINPKIAKQYLQQIDFKIKNRDKTQFALGFKNDDGGFEFRNRLMKGLIGETKTITSINIQPNQKIAIFEGFFDFLSYLTDHQITDFQSSAIILNSTILENKAREILTSTNFEKAYFFLDNDESGKKHL